MSLPPRQRRSSVRKSGTRMVASSAHRLWHRNWCLIFVNVFNLVMLVSSNFINQHVDYNMRFNWGAMHYRMNSERYHFAKQCRNIWPQESYGGHADISLSHKIDSLIASMWVQGPARIPRLWTDAWLIFLQKPAKSGEEAKHYRPIGLQCPAGKVAITIIAKRLKPKVLDWLVETKTAVWIFSWSGHLWSFASSV